MQDRRFEGLFKNGPGFSFHDCPWGSYQNCSHMQASMQVDLKQRVIGSGIRRSEKSNSRDESDHGRSASTAALARAFSSKPRLSASSLHRKEIMLPGTEDKAGSGAIQQVSIPHETAMCRIGTSKHEAVAVASVGESGPSGSDG